VPLTCSRLHRLPEAPLLVIEVLGNLLLVQ
jgi:hypothetical protein